jgi:cell filamentation protein
MIDSIAPLEARLTWVRMTELQFQSLPPRFDAQYLKEVHRYIFQDFPAHGLSDPPPGQFRGYVKVNDWYKVRKLESVNGTSTICYSSMDKKSLNEFDTAISTANPAVLQKLNPKDFAMALAKLYQRLDYTHPFFSSQPFGGYNTYRARSSRPATPSRLAST